MSLAYEKAALTFFCHVALTAGLFVIAGEIAGTLQWARVLEAAHRLDVVGAILLSGLVAAMEASAQQGDDAEVSSRADRSLAIATGVSLALLMCGAPIVRTFSAVPSIASGISGILLLFLGGLLRARSIRVLASAFVTEPAPASDRSLVRKDVYAIVRHPSELGLHAMALGTALLCPSAFSFAVAGFVMALSLVRVRREELRLSERFGERYAEYATSVPRILPIRSIGF